MKMDKVANSKNDEFYTPEYAVKPILKYIPNDSRVWCPFDTNESHFVKQIRGKKCLVTPTHKDSGDDFFVMDVVNPTPHYIVSNPPYSLKTEVLERLFSLGIPFAMLLGVVGLFESKKRFKMFRDNQFEILYFNRRIAYFKDYSEQSPSLHPPFSSVYITQNMLPNRIVFEELEAPGKQPNPDKVKEKA